MADQYVLSHRSDWGNGHGYDSNYRDSTVGHGLSVASYKTDSEVKGTHLRDVEKVCHFSQKKGHVKADCYALERKNEPMCVKSSSLAAPVANVT